MLFGGGPQSPQSDQRWRLLAQCRDSDYEQFAVQRITTSDDKQEALEMCWKCPVRHECKLDALRNGDVWWAVRGGMMPKELRKAAREAGIWIRQWEDERVWP